MPGVRMCCAFMAMSLMMIVFGFCRISRRPAARNNPIAGTGHGSADATACPTDISSIRHSSGRTENHRLIVEALGRLRRESGDCPTVVFAGGYADPLRARTFIDVMELAGTLGVGGHVHYLGFVPDRDMPVLYSLSAGLVMPTFFGPTNLPPLEAWAFGCPVITTDLPSIRDHLGDAALYVDPRDAGSLAQAMRSLWQDEVLVARLMANAARRLASFPYEDFLIALKHILDEGVERVRAGRTPVMPDSWRIDDDGGA